MKREKQKCCVLFCFIVYIILTNNAFVARGHTNINKLLNNTSLNVNIHERSASIFTPVSENGQQNNQYLKEYFKKVMEPIRNLTNGERRHIYSSTINTINTSSTEPLYRTRINDMNTQPNYIYPSLHSTPYIPMVVTERYHPQNHLTQKKDSAESSKLKISARSDKINLVDKFLRLSSEVFIPRIIPIEQSDPILNSKSSNVLDNEGEIFQPFVPAETESRAVKSQRIPIRRKDALQNKATREATTTTRSPVLTSTQAPRKNVPGISRSSPNSRVLEEEPRSKIKKKYQKYMLPLLLAYKLKFFTLIPLMMGGLVLLTGATGMAGFFFALFASVIGLRAGSSQN